MELELENWSNSQQTSPASTPTPPPTSVSTDTTAIPPQTSLSDSLHTSPSQPLPAPVSSSSTHSPPLSNGQSLTNIYTTFTTSYPVIISQPSTTFTSYATSIVTTSTPMAVTQTPSPQANLGVNSVCIGEGIDSVSIGLLAVAILSALFGFVIWVRVICVLQPICILSSVADSGALIVADICHRSTQIPGDLRSQGMVPPTRVRVPPSVTFGKH